jgi:hypothetical protein
MNFEGNDYVREPWGARRLLIKSAGWERRRSSMRISKRYKLSGRR